MCKIKYTYNFKYFACLHWKTFEKMFAFENINPWRFLCFAAKVWINVKIPLFFKWLFNVKISSSIVLFYWFKFKGLLHTSDNILYVSEIKIALLKYKWLDAVMQPNYI